MKNKITEILQDNKTHMREGARSKVELARACNTSESYVSRLATGAIQNPGISMTLAVAKALNRPVDEIFYEEESVAATK